MTSLRASRFVIDSNVWVSALVFGGAPRQVFEGVVSDGIALVVSAELLSEIRRILTQKFPDFLADFDALLVALQQNLTVVLLGSITISASRDPDDNKVLGTAILGHVTEIITGDKNLPVLKAYETIRNQSPRDWLNH
jgi:putative PIN family toxin of toxin-antitoxin system